MRACGPSAEVILEYRRLLHEAEKDYFTHVAATRTPQPTAPVAAQRSDALSFGDLDAEIIGVQVLDERGSPSSAFYPGQSLTIRVMCEARKLLDRLNVAVRIRSKEGVKVYSWGTLNQDIAVWAGRTSASVFWDRSFAPGERVTVDFVCDCALGANLYEVQVALSQENDRFYQSQRMLHWRDEAAFFQVQVATHEYFFGGMCDLRMRAYVRD
jgi:lipopolysaccharide transport system ATP-binding protein